MKYLALPFAPSLAHVSRSLAVAELLRARGHEVVFGLGAERLQLVQRAGFEATALSELTAAEFRRARLFDWVTRERFSRALTEERELLAASGAQAVIWDFRLSAPVSAKDAGVPSFSIVHGNALELARAPGAAARKLVAGGNPVFRAVFPRVFELLLRRGLAAVRPLLRERGFNQRTPFELLVCGTPLVAELPRFLPFELSPPDVLCGPLLWSGWAKDVPGLEFPSARPLIYVTLGTTVEGQATLRALLAALGTMDCEVVVSSGDLHLPPSELPANVRAFATVPGEAVVRRSALVIHHGGHETLMQVLAHGRPSLIVPSNPDQILVGQAVEAQGLGLCLRSAPSRPVETAPLARVSADQLRGRVGELLGSREIISRCVAVAAELAALRADTRWLARLEG